MSSAEPPAPPVQPTRLRRRRARRRLPRHYPHPIAYVISTLVPLLLAAVLVVPYLLVAARPPAAVPEPTAPATPPPAPGAGAGDPYFPDYGSSGWDALKYTLNLSFDPATQTLSGTSTIAARATASMSSFWFDLALDVSSVTVDGTPAPFRRSGFSDVEVQRAVTTGETFDVVVRYAGRPGTLTNNGIRPWYAAGQEWTIAGEPEAAAWWFPSDDYPSDPALFDVSVRVPTGWQVLSVGALASRDTGQEPGFDSWHWVLSQPAATYLEFLAIGHYVIEQGTADGRPYVYAVSAQLPKRERDADFATLRKTPAVVGELSMMFGPYPFTEVGGVAPASRLGFDGLEAQTRPVYAANALASRFGLSLIVHELAHMWFGDSVTVRQWNDIFDNEAYASFAVWAYDERTGGRSANSELTRTFAEVRDKPRFWRITMTDPGRSDLFDAVYFRGPMTLQALRNVMGDAAFFRFSRAWAQQPGSRSLEDWMVRAQAATPVDLAPFFDAWLASPTAPAPSKANGFPS